MVHRAAFIALVVMQAVPGGESVAPHGPTPAVQAQQGSELELVTVEARRRRARIEQEVSQFVVSIVGTAKVESLSRWKVPICTVIVGLATAQAEFVEKRVWQVARDAGVPVGDEDCGPNFVAVVTPEPAKLLKDWWAEDHDLFDRDRGLGGVNRMIRTDQPVRVWHNACDIPPLRGFYEPSGALNCNTGVTGSRLTWSSIRAIYSAIVVIDIDQVESLTFGQVADYVAMVGLAKIRPNPDLGNAPTILGLFGANGGDRAKGLTTWDQSFLRAIYATTDGSVTELAQIKLRMSEDLAR